MGTFPAMGLVQLRLDLWNVLARDLGVRIDVGLAGSGDTEVVVRDDYVGTYPYDVAMSQVTAGVALTKRFPLGSEVQRGGAASYRGVAGQQDIHRRRPAEPVLCHHDPRAGTRSELACTPVAPCGAVHAQPLHVFPRGRVTISFFTWTGV